jgi:hypothetical protein
MKISYWRPSPDHLKIGDINFYPNTGTITFDGVSKAWKEKGLDALVERIEARRRRLNELLAARARSGEPQRPQSPACNRSGLSRKSDGECW